MPKKKSTNSSPKKSIESTKSRTSNKSKRIKLSDTVKSHEPEIHYANNKYAMYENWRDYTTEEINEIKKEVCVGQKCPYASKLQWMPKGRHTNSSSVAHITCNYLLITKKMRECFPDVCQHWRDKNVQVKSVDNHDLFSK